MEIIRHFFTGNGIMNITFAQYIQSVAGKFTHKETSEMGYRTDFEIMLAEVFSSINVKRIDHDAKAKQGNKPDFVVLKNNIPILYIEAKDIGVSLDKVEKSEQMARYFGYANLVLTDYLEFRFYRNGLPYREPISIASYDLKHRTITPHPQNYSIVAEALIAFSQGHKEPIKSGEHLAKIMGGKAQRIRDNVKSYFEKSSEIGRIYDIIKKLLVHDLKEDAFADMYAQTLVYGLFVARYHDDTSDTFTRQEARDLIPASNPFLQHFFDHIAGPNFDKRFGYIVNELCEVFNHANIQELMKQYYQNDLFGETHKQPDPVIHFYEDFLKEYDPELRKKMGAFYTPLPVVRFIVRTVDQILKKEFGLPAGLSDTTKNEDGLHNVQILDPAVGTGTFISATIRNIYQHLVDSGQKGRWPKYVHNDLLPRLHGFELMMTPYTIAHLKLSMAFKDTGFSIFNNRLGIYLTNSLEKESQQIAMPFMFGLAESIAEESKAAEAIKNKKPIMVVLGNPPYSVSSSNKSRWILKLLEEYKTGLNERNIQPLSDDYIKFIRLAEHFVEKNKTGIVAMITNNSFLDGLIHRQMRKHLLETFDDIYIVDLHGNSKKKETAPDGGKDENVFDIQQGVSISIFVKKPGKGETIGNVYHTGLYGKRESKFGELNKSDLYIIPWQKLDCPAPNYFFVPKDFDGEAEYKTGFSVNELFQLSASGIKTHRDHFVIDMDGKVLQARITRFFDAAVSDDIIRKEMSLKDNSDFNMPSVRKNGTFNEQKIKKITYRPFDNRFIYYDTTLIDRNRENVMKHIICGSLVFICFRQSRNNEQGTFWISNSIVGKDAISSLDTCSAFPLYLYATDNTRTPNLKAEIVAKIESIVGKTTPEEIFDYIYATLHSPRYRDRYKEFLKIEFPRIPYPQDKDTFTRLVSHGTELRLLHLMESPKLGQYITTYPETGTDTVESVTYQNNRVIINKEQYFGNVPELAWNFYIGGYQPAQKWLKDRKGRTLSDNDIDHYQKMITALTETSRIMGEIDLV